MNNFISTIIAVSLLTLTLIVGYGIFVQDKQDNNQVSVGGEFVGTESLSHIKVGAGMTEGGAYTISTTSATWTLNPREIRDVKVIAIADTASAVLTLTLPASSTWQGLEKVGDTQSWVIDNLHSNAATTTTITAGTGVDIDGTTANDDVINGGVSGRLDCWRLATSDIRCIVEEMVDAG